MGEKTRCPWAGNTPIYVSYHDKEWGRPEHDDGKLFAMLTLECMQAGLAWITVLKKREAFKEAFDGFDPEKMARYDEAKKQQLMANAQIIRNRLKIEAAISNARVFLELAGKGGGFSDFLWRYVDYTPLVGHWTRMDEVPASTPMSDQISKDLKKMGCKFVGSTTIYAFMQAVGMVNDHLTSCFVYDELTSLQKGS